MPLDSLSPFAGDHAIQSVTFVVEWESELQPHELERLRGAHAAFMRWLPKINETRTLQFTMSAPGQAAASSGREVLGGFIFFKPFSLNPSGASAQVEFHSNRCQIVIFEYSRWAQAWDSARTWFNIAIDSIPGGRPISSIGLQYTDIFKWRDDPKKLMMSEVFSSSSKFIPRNAGDLDSLWHSHHGYFAQRKEPIEHQLLENVNVNVLDEQGIRVVAITTSHRGTLTSKLWGKEQAMDGISKLMPDFHGRNKKILVDLLTKEVQEKIRINGDSKNV